MNNSDFWSLLPSVLVGVIVTAVIGAVSSGSRKKTAQLRADRFEVCHPKAIAIIGCICMLVFAAFLAASFYALLVQHSLDMQQVPIVLGVFGFFFLLGAALTLMGLRWRLEVGLDIVYVPALGRVQVIPFEQIGYMRQLSTKFKVYDKFHRRLFTVEQSCIGSTTLINALRSHSIPLQRQESLWQVIKFRLTHMGERRQKAYLPKSARKRQPPAKKVATEWQREYARQAALPPDLPAQFESMLRGAQRSSIRLFLDSPAPAAMRPGASKLGGLPDLPPTFRWPYYEEYDYNDVFANRPLAFLLQLNCADLRPYDKDSLLPPTGLLSFFYELDSMPWGPDTSEKGYFQVHYFAEPPEALLQTALPPDLNAAYRIPETRLRFASQPSFPSYAEFSVGKGLRHHVANQAVYEQALAALGGAAGEAAATGYSRMLGYPDSIQNDVFDEFEMQWRKQQPPESPGTAAQWQLLLQLDSALFEQAGAPGIMFGDCGSIYFGLRKEALQRRAFENVWFTLQCY